MSQDKTLRDAMGATIIGGTATTYLVQYEDGAIESVSNDSLHGAICELSEIDPSTDVRARGRALDYDGHDGDGIDVELNVDTTNMRGELTIGGRADTVTITGSELGQALLAVEEEALSANNPEIGDTDSGPQSVSARMSQSSTTTDTSFDQTNAVLSNETASNLYDVYENALATRVREDLVNSFANQFAGVAVEDSGWVIEDTYMLTYDAENYLVDDIDTYTVSGSSVAETDGEQQAVGLKFDTEPYAVFTIAGQEYTLSENEQHFLASAEFLTSPSNYLEVDSFETEVYSAIREAKGDPLVRGAVEELASSVRVGHFIDPKSGLIHRHDIDKHVLRSTFKIRSWVVEDLNYSSFDHAGVSELSYREAEFRNADEPVFFDGSDNDDDEKWNHINQVEKDAPCPPEVYRRLQSMYGSN